MGCRRWRRIDAVGLFTLSNRIGADSRRGCLRAGSSGPPFDRSGWQSIHPDADSHAPPAHPQPPGAPSHQSIPFRNRARSRPQPRNPDDCAGQLHPTASSGSLPRPLFKLIRAWADPKVPRSALLVPTLGSTSPKAATDDCAGQVHPTASSGSLSASLFNQIPIAAPIRKYSPLLSPRPILGNRASRPAPNPDDCRRPGSPHSKRKKPIPTFQANSDVGPSDSTPALSPGPFRNAPPTPSPNPTTAQARFTPQQAAEAFSRLFSTKFPPRPNQKYPRSLPTSHFGTRLRPAPNPDDCAG